MKEKEILKLKASYNKKYTISILITLSTMLFIILNIKQEWLNFDTQNWIIVLIGIVCAIGICFVVFYSFRLRGIDMYEYLSKKDEEIEET